MVLHRRTPNISCAGRLCRPMLGKGMGSVILNTGGTGGGSSYDSPQDYAETTGRGLGRGHMADKLSKLIVKPISKKPKNINFSM